MTKSIMSAIALGSVLTVGAWAGEIENKPDNGSSADSVVLESKTLVDVVKKERPACWAKHTCLPVGAGKLKVKPGADLGYFKPEETKKIWSELSPGAREKIEVLATKGSVVKVDEGELDKRKTDVDFDACCSIEVKQ